MFNLFSKKTLKMYSIHPIFQVLLAVSFSFSVLSACDKQDSTDNKESVASTEPVSSVKPLESAVATPAAVTTLSNEEKVQKGKIIYFSTCTACHNSNPAMPGSVGPEIKGSKFPLLKARILNSSYPEGYKPKRTTHIMPKFPLTEEQITYVEAFLNN
jgi:mono/diheme cytochrome c family protein